jgi:hypothetical protein
MVIDLESPRKEICTMMRIGGPLTEGSVGESVSASSRWLLKSFSCLFPRPARKGTCVDCLHSFAMDSKPEDAVSHYGDADNKKDHEVDSSTEMKIDIANTDLVAPLGAAKKPNPRSCSLSQLWIITRRRFGKGRGYLRMDLFLPLVFYVISPGAHCGCGWVALNCCAGDLVC